MLNHQRNRNPLTRRTAAAIVGAMLAIAVPVAAVSVTTPPPAPIAASGVDVPLTPDDVAEAAPAVATLPRVEAASALPAAAPATQEKPASIKGTIYDQLGGLLPGVALTLTDQGFGISYNAVTDRNGSFAFNELQPATYELATKLPGFASVSSVMPIGAGAVLERRITLPIGSLEETITVGCERSSAPSAPRRRDVLQPRPPGSRATAPAVTGAVPFSGGMGGQIAAPRQISKSNPICPNHVGVDTVVVLGARVGIDGYLSDLRPIARGDEKPAPEIVESAVEAIRLWQYTPTLLNGVPVEANIRMTVYYNW
jgi:hypothetical protein